MLAILGFVSCFAASWLWVFPTRSEPDKNADQPTAESDLQAVPQDASVTGLDANVTNFAEERVKELTNGRERGDRYLSCGNVVRALDEYSRVAADSPQSNGDALSFRLALCREEMKHYDEALAEYERLATTSQDSSIANAAKLGKCRVDLQLQREIMVEHILWKWLIQSGETVEQDRSDDAAYLLAHLLLERIKRDQPDSYLAPAALAFPTLDLSAPEILNRSLADEKLNEPLATTPDTLDATADPDGVADWELVQQFGDSPEAAVFRAAVSKEAIHTLIERFCSDAKVNVKWSPSGRDEVSRRFTGLNIRNMPLALILDALLCPRGLTWRKTDEGIEIFDLSEVQDTAQKKAQVDICFRLLRHLVVAHPTHPDASVGLVALGNMAFLRNDPAQATSNYQETIRAHPRSKQAIHASFNLGKIHLSNNQRADAERMFYQVVDDLESHPFRSAAYIQLARIFLGDDQPSRAIKAARHALNMADNKGDQTAAAVSLASAYLMAKHYHGANDTLHKYQTALENSQYNNVGALLSAEARLSAAKSQPKKDSAGRALLNAIVRAKPDMFLGEHGHLIVARANRHVGMLSDAEKQYILGAQQTNIGKLRDRMRFELADLYRQKGELDKAQEILTELATRKHGIGWESIEQLAEVAYVQRHDQDCERYCLAIVSQESHQKKALELLGKLYERQGHHKLAAECFAGKLPPTNPSRSP